MLKIITLFTILKMMSSLEVSQKCDEAAYHWVENIARAIKDIKVWDITSMFLDYTLVVNFYFESIKKCESPGQFLEQSFQYTNEDGQVCIDQAFTIYRESKENLNEWTSQQIYFVQFLGKEWELIQNNYSIVARCSNFNLKKL